MQVCSMSLSCIQFYFHILTSHLSQIMDLEQIYCVAATWVYMICNSQSVAQLAQHQCTHALASSVKGSTKFFFIIPRSYITSYVISMGCTKTRNGK